MSSSWCVFESKLGGGGGGGGELVIQGEGFQRRSILCSTARAIRYLQQDYSGFVAYVMDIREKGKATVDDVLVVWEYSDVFPDYLPKVPQERQVVFRIDLVPGVVPIAKGPY